MYGYVSIIPNDIFNKLNRYLSIIKKVKFDIETNTEKPCLSSKQLERLVGDINRYTNPKNFICKENIEIDNSNVMQWELSHPHCVTRNRWEELAYRICDDLDIKMESINKSCELVFDLSQEIISCDTITALSIYEQICNIEGKVIRTDRECKIDYELLLEKHSECDITYDIYRKLIACGMSYDIIEQIICDGLTIGIEDGVPTIKSILGTYVVGSNISFNNIISPNACNKSICRTNGTCDIDDSKFIMNLMNDYNLTKAQKQDILSKIGRF